jgi:glutathione S-transferase
MTTGEAGMKLTVIGHVRSRTLRVLWLLEELGLPYDHTAATPMSAEARTLSPTAKVPALRVDDVTITDSVAIMTFLADREGAFTSPAGTLERAVQDGVTQQINDELDCALWMAAKHSFALPEEHRMPAIKDSLKWDFARGVAALSGRLGDAPYFGGDNPTIPDFLAAHCAGWALNARFPFDDVRLRAHMERMRARPAYGRAMALAG